ncbi:MAG: hypothetical protein ACPG32_07280 [Akkermansiaceae bacterium]
MKPSTFALLCAAGVHCAHADDIQALGDEFGSSITQSQWTQLNDTEGWNANQLELWDVNPSYAPGNMVMAPYSSGWYMDMRGVLVYKEITGNFIATMRMRVTRRGENGQLPNEAGFTERSGAPSRQFSLAGVFVRTPRSITQAAPNPLPSGSPSWPPPAAGQPGHFTTDWSPDGDNYIFLSFGSAGNQGDWQYEVKTTLNGDSRLYYNDHGIPADVDEAQVVTLQFIRVGNTVVTLRKHADGPWIVENRYTQSPSSPLQQLPDFGDTLQVGITTYTDWNSIGGYFSGGNHASQYEHNYRIFDGPGHNPDLIANVDYYRFQRPDPALTEATLQALPITFMASPRGGVEAVPLPDDGAGAYLGDNANTPTPALNEDADGDGMSALLEAVFGTSPAVADAQQLTPELVGDQFQLSFPYSNNLNGVTLRIQQSSTLAEGTWTDVATRTQAGWTLDPPHEVTETGTNIQFSTPHAGGTSFYRLHVETSP